MNLHVKQNISVNRISMNKIRRNFGANSLLVVLFLITTWISSCKKDLTVNEQNSNTSNMVSRTKDLKVSNNFKWSTIHEVQVEIAPKKSGLLLIQGVNAEIFYKAFLQPNVPHIATLALPNIHDKMYIYYNGAQEMVSVNTGSRIKSNLR